MIGSAPRVLLKRKLDMRKEPSMKIRFSALNKVVFLGILLFSFVLIGCAPGTPTPVPKLEMPITPPVQDLTPSPPADAAQTPDVTETPTPPVAETPTPPTDQTPTPTVDITPTPTPDVDQTPTPTPDADVTPTPDATPTPLFRLPFIPDDDDVVTVEVTARDFEFDPDTIEVEAGQRVRFVISVEDSFHTFSVRQSEDATEDIIHINLCPEEICPDAEAVRFEHVFPEPGEYYLYCRVHEAQGMVGTIIVE
jgi:plastocyanin